MLAARFTTSAIRNAQVARITVTIHISIGFFFAEGKRLWLDTARKKIRNAASSKAAETGSSTRQCHRYEFANQRISTPPVHITQQVHPGKNRAPFAEILICGSE